MAWINRRGKAYQLRWRGPDGRECTQTYATKAAAEKAAKLLEAHKTLSAARPAAVPGEQVTVGQWWNRWHPGQSWSPSTRDTYESAYRVHVGPVFGRMPLSAVMVADVDRWHRILERKLKPATLKKVHFLFSGLMAGAEREGLIDKNPVRLAKLRRTPRQSRVALTDDQAEQLRDAFAEIEPRLVAYYDVCLLAGLRRNEARSLTWDRIDFDTGFLVVDRQLDHGVKVGELRWAQLKTTNSARRVPMTSALIASLRAHRARFGIGPLVFVRADGSAWPTTALSDQWRVVAARAGVPASVGGMHVTRHTFGSRLAELGIPAPEAASIFGDTVTTYLSTYSHVLHPDVAAERIRSALDGR